MNLFKSLFKKKEKEIHSNTDFWDWFKNNEKEFHKAVKKHTSINADFLDKLGDKLDKLDGEIWFLAGMFDNQTAELILTADGSLKNIAFVEKLMKEAPKLENWKLTCLKQPSASNDFSIKMNGYNFDKTTMSFYPINHPEMPDEIDIVVTHKELNDKNIDDITKGVYLALDNGLGEINSITTIDNLEIIHPDKAEQDLIPLNKLAVFLIWREKEFIEKYDGIRINSENDNYNLLEGTLNSGLPIVAVVNTDLLKWDKKASHPWLNVLTLKYDGTNNNGMPEETSSELMTQIEDELTILLKDSEGYLNIGRETGNNERKIYFASIDFRIPSLVFYDNKKKYSDSIDFDYDIYKDKYWRSCDKFL